MARRASSFKQPVNVMGVRKSKKTVSTKATRAGTPVSHSSDADSDLRPVRAPKTAKKATKAKKGCVRRPKPVS